MKNFPFLKALEVLICLGVGLLAAYEAHRKIHDEFVVDGVMVGFLFVLILEFYRDETRSSQAEKNITQEHQELERQIDGVNTKVETSVKANVIPLEHKMEKYEQHLRSICETLAGDETRRKLVLDAISLCIIRVDDGAWREVWKRLSWSVSKTYIATNYIDPKVMYHDQTSHNVLSIQRAKKAADNVKFSKIFILDRAEELGAEQMRSVVTAHREAKIPINYITRDKIQKVDALESKLKQINGLIDFAVFDNDIVLIWNLDEKRAIKNLELRLGREQAEQFTKFYEVLLTYSHEDFEKYAPAAIPVK